MKLLTFFNHAGPNDHVTFTKNGREITTGPGLSGWILPGTSVTVVPLGVKTLTFHVSERSKDQQEIAVIGEAIVVNTAEMRHHFDFSVNKRTGQYRKDPTRDVEELVRVAVRSPIRTQLVGMDLAAITTSGTDKIEAALATEVENVDSPLMKRLQAHNIKVLSISILAAKPEDEDLADAIGADERFAHLTALDDAQAARRMAAAVKDREIRTYDEETSLELAKSQAERVKQDGENEVAAAEAEAQATTKRLEPFSDMDAGAVLAHALMKAAGEGGLGRVSIEPGILQALQGATTGR